MKPIIDISITWSWGCWCVCCGLRRRGCGYGFRRRVPCWQGAGCGGCGGTVNLVKDRERKDFSGGELVFREDRAKRM